MRSQARANTDRVPEHPAHSIVVSDRLRLRWPHLDDAELLASVVADSLFHLSPWMPWATPQAADVDEQRKRRAELLAQSEAGTDYMYLLLSPEGAVLGACGMHRRVGPGAVEVGYWLDPAHVGRGYMTEAVRAVVQAALGLSDVDRVEIHCDEANLRSQAVARRLGFRLDRIEVDAVQAPAEVGRSMIWVYPA